VGTKSENRAQRANPLLSLTALGIDEAKYRDALKFLFDRPVAAGEDAWYWNLADQEFTATPLEWTRIQTAIYSRCATDLNCYSDDQVGMGLNYIMSNCVSDVPYAAIDPSVPLTESMRMMRAFPELWRSCIGPRLRHLKCRIGSGNDPLGFVCYMWFDVWPTFYNVRQTPEWRDAVWAALDAMLAVPCREVQIGALHGIGHEGPYLERQKTIDKRIGDYIRSIGATDDELVKYAMCARVGRVQ
jgi:hypothetical protein